MNLNRLLTALICLGTLMLLNRPASFPATTGNQVQPLLPVDAIAHRPD